MVHNELDIIGTLFLHEEHQIKRIYNEVAHRVHQGPEVDVFGSIHTFRVIEHILTWFTDPPHSKRREEDTHRGMED